MEGQCTFPAPKPLDERLGANQPPGSIADIPLPRLDREQANLKPERIGALDFRRTIDASGPAGEAQQIAHG